MPNNNLIQNLKSAETWFTAGITWAMVLLVAITIGQADLIRSFNMLPLLIIITTLGYLAGIALSKSRFPGLTAHIYALVYGIFFTAFLIGDTMADDLIWRERIADMIARQAEWFTKLIDGGTSRDSMTFIMHTIFILWWLAYSASWYTYRKPRLWRVVLPSGLVLLSVVYYYFGPRPLLVYLALYCVLALLYIAQTHVRDNKREWHFKAVRFETGIASIFLRSSLLIALLALIVAWQLPAMAASTSVGDTVNRVNEPWRQFREDWQRLYSALNSQTAGTSDPYRDTLTLGGPRNVGDTPIMDVYVDERLPYAYWRSTVLDRYEDGQWRVAEGDTVTQFPDDPPLKQPSDQARKSVDQLFVNYVPNAGTIYSAPEIATSDRQILVKTELDAAGNNLISAVRSRYVLQLGDRYEVTSNLSVADESSLRNAGSAYPAHITADYLDVPTEITQRTLDLADELTAQYDNPYDKAIAVQNFLREHIEYNDQIDAPPPDVEPIDFILFESPEGYCNYYASAMAMMLRSQGIPTRLGRGYASGEFNEDNGLYRVRASDAHVWVEVYFPTYGWIQFEPTAIIETVAREAGSDEPAPDAGGELEDEFSQIEDLQEDQGLEEDAGPVAPEETPEEPTGGVLSSTNIVRVFVAVLAVAVAAFLVVMAERMNRSVEGTLAGSYGRLATWASWLGVNFLPSQTPFERANLLVVAAPEGETPIRNLTGEYVRTTYSPDKKQRFFVNPILEWKTLRPILFKKTLRQRLPRFMHRFVS